MILVDLSQVMISNLMMQIGNHRNAELDENMIRHMVLNSIRSYRSKFVNEYGELVICADDKNYWRRVKFPYYKALRKTARDKDELDWAKIFTALNGIRNDLREYFPYQMIQVETAEADDIIGTIVHHKGTVLNGGEKILILSGDKDYIQLHVYGNVRQYDPTRKRWIHHNNPKDYLYEHIMKGDRGDGIPNVLSSDDTFVVGVRQKPVTQKKLEIFKDINNLDDNIKRNYMRNKSLIDLSQVPENVRESIIAEYEAGPTNDRSKIYSYFFEKGLANLLEDITDF